MTLIHSMFVGAERLSNKNEFGITETGFENYGDTLECSAYERNA